MSRINQKRFGVVVRLILVLLVGVLCSTMALAEIPRILLVGDSWTGFLLAFRSFKQVLPEYPGLDRWIEVGNRTAVMGSRGFELHDSLYLNTLTDELTRFPNIDVVVMTLGGNDFMRGLPNVLPWNPGRTVSWYHWWRENTDGNPATDWDADLLFNRMKSDIAYIVDYMLAIRPDIRVVIVGYDYGARPPKPGDTYSVEEQHLALLEMELRKREIAEERDRVEYVLNFGMMQYTYGIPEASPPIAPGMVPYPGEAPAWDPWPGGLPQYLSPLSAYIDQDIHLTADGYAVVARRAIDLYIETWLNYPKALEILPLDETGAVRRFRVTFSHPVQGVDASDFLAVTEGAKGLKALSITDVSPATGPAEQYVVTVNMGGDSGAIALHVMDNDSITRADTGAPLGGPGADNGYFSFNGVYPFTDLPHPDDNDFAASIEFLYQASMAYEHLLYGFSFNPLLFDANGNLALEGNITSEPYIIPGNGMLDLYEFMLIDTFLNRPELDLSAQGGPSHQTVMNAWNKNLSQIQLTLGGAGGLADTILPGLDTVLAGYMTLGDSNSISLTTSLVLALAMIEEFPTNINIGGLNPAQFDFLNQWFAMNGDADGDGFTNEEEYAYFAVDGLEAYIAAALNPGIQPKTGAGTHRKGVHIRIAMFDTPKWDTSFQWYRNGLPLVDDDRIVGANSRTLDIAFAVASDSGAYTCVYQKPLTGAGGQSETATYGPIDVLVTESVPASGMAGMAILIALIAAAGMWRLRRVRAPFQG